MLTLQRRSIEKDNQLLVQKSIQKPKQKNQYTVNIQFKEEFEKKKKQGIIKEFHVVQLHKQIFNNNVFRLQSNVQIPQNATSNQLGYLNINHYSYNYKVNRIDRKGRFINLTFDPIQRPFIPVEVVKEMMAKCGEKVQETFWEHHCKKQQLFTGLLEEGNFEILTEQQLTEFENSISQKPVSCYISKVGKDSLVTQYNIINDAFLSCLGINGEMFIHYVTETGAFPFPLFFAVDENNLQHLTHYFKMTTLNHGQTELMATNYNGQKFPVKFNFHNYYIYDEVEKCYFEYIFFVWDLDKRWISRSKILENHRDYFNLKEQPELKSFSSSDTQIYFEEMRCGYKSIFQQK